MEISYEVTVEGAIVLVNVVTIFAVIVVLW